MESCEFNVNPVAIQTERKALASTASTPLVLFHDGGGTLYSYFLLDSLERDVYGLADPRSSTNTPWEGGVEEMAQHHYDRMRDALSPGPIILGGWSFRGLLALQTAYIIRNQASTPFSVAGVILIDTTCPLGAHLCAEESRIIPENCLSPALRDLAQASMDRAAEMTAQWEPPALSKASAKGMEVVLLRATETMSPDADSPSRPGRLHWDLYPDDLSLSVIPISGNHLTIFRLEYVSEREPG